MRVHVATLVMVAVVAGSVRLRADEEAIDDEANTGVERGSVEHGSGSGYGDSLGPGDGDGLGAPPDDDDAETPPPPAQTERDEGDPLRFEIGAFDIRPRAQYRVRYYHREGRDFAPGGGADVVRHRARAGFDLWWEDELGVVIALQDVRGWGSEDDTRDFDADGFDAREAYFEARPVTGLSLRIGRQHVGLLGHRLIGVAPFSERQRSFDAARLRYEHEGLEAELSYSTVLEDTPGGPSGHTGWAQLGYEVTPWLDPHVVGVVEADNRAGAFARGTAGAYVEGHVESGVAVSYEAEGYYQYGGVQSLRWEGWFAGAKLRAEARYEIAPFVQAHAVLSSGDGDLNDDTFRSFRRPFPSPHRFHGEMDLFLDIPADTDRKGLRDLGGTIGFSPLGVDTQAAVYVFDAMQPRGGDQHFGWELDFKASYPIWKYLSVDALYGFFVPGALKEPTGGGRIEHFAYVTANAQF